MIPLQTHSPIQRSSYATWSHKGCFLIFILKQISLHDGKQPWKPAKTVNHTLLLLRSKHSLRSRWFMPASPETLQLLYNEVLDIYKARHRTKPPAAKLRSFKWLACRCSELRTISHKELYKVLYIVYTLYIQIMRIILPSTMNTCKIVNMLNMYSWQSLSATDKLAC